MPPAILSVYVSPKVRLGERVICLYRDAECRITSWSNARISWPRCQPIGQRGGSGLWVNLVLERAILTESFVSLRYWFGASKSVVQNWRAWADVKGHATTPGSKLAQRSASEAGASAVRGLQLSDEACDLRAKFAKEKDLARFMKDKRWASKGWTIEQEAMLGTMPDAAVAELIGRSENAVRQRRERRRIPRPT